MRRAGRSLLGADLATTRRRRRRRRSRPTKLSELLSCASGSLVSAHEPETKAQERDERGNSRASLIFKADSAHQSSAWSDFYLGARRSGEPASRRLAVAPSLINIIERFATPFSAPTFLRSRQPSGHIKSSLAGKFSPFPFRHTHTHKLGHALNPCACSSVATLGVFSEQQVRENGFSAGAGKAASSELKQNYLEPAGWRINQAAAASLLSASRATYGFGGRT